MSYSVIIVLLTFATFVKSSEFCTCPTSDDDLSTLKSLHILMRHGIRAPYSTYPFDPNFNQTNRWPNGKSQLTDAGIEQAYNVGKFYSMRYSHFIKNNEKNAYLRSSAAQRCIDTISIVAKTLWPPKEGDSKWWQKMIFSLPKQIDGVLYGGPDCHLANKEEENNLKTPEVEKYEKDPKIQALYRYVASHSGLPPTMDSVNKALDNVRSEKLNGLPLPDWVTPEKYEEMGDVWSKKLNFLYKSRKAQRLRTGLFFKDLKTNMNEVINAKSDDKPKNIFIYGTHDFKIASVLSALGEPQPIYPPFAAAIIFELHRIGNQNIVRALYLNQTVNWPYTAIRLKLPNCLKAGATPISDSHNLHHNHSKPTPKPAQLAQNECTFDDFVNSVADLTPVDWRIECGIDCNYDPFKVAEYTLGKT